MTYNSRLFVSLSRVRKRWSRSQRALTLTIMHARCSAIAVISAVIVVSALFAAARSDPERDNALEPRAVATLDAQTLDSDSGGNGTGGTGESVDDC